MATVVSELTTLIQRRLPFNHVVEISFPWNEIVETRSKNENNEIFYLVFPWKAKSFLCWDFYKIYSIVQLFKQIWRWTFRRFSLEEDLIHPDNVLQWLLGNICDQNLEMLS